MILIYLPEYTVINKQFAGKTLALTHFITGHLSGEIQETPRLTLGSNCSR
jgi:hypothetical protein